MRLIVAASLALYALGHSLSIFFNSASIAAAFTVSAGGVGFLLVVRDEFVSFEGAQALVANPKPMTDDASRIDNAFLFIGS
jgi:hypothetical protein